MLKKILPLALICLPLSQIAMADNTSNNSLNYNIINFSESSSRDVARDTMTIYLNVRQEGKNKNAVTSEFVKKYNSLNQKLKNNSQFTSELIDRSIYPQYETIKGKNTLIGWQEQARVKVESKNFSALNQLIADSQNETNLENVSFSLSKEKNLSVIDGVTNEAINKFKQRASSLAKSFGSNQYKIVQLTVDQNNTRPYSGMALMSARSMKMNEDVAVPDIPNAGDEEVRITIQGAIQF